MNKLLLVLLISCPVAIAGTTDLVINHIQQHALLTGCEITLDTQSTIAHTQGLKSLLVIGPNVHTATQKRRVQINTPLERMQAHFQDKVDFIYINIVDDAVEVSALVASCYEHVKHKGFLFGRGTKNGDQLAQFAHEQGAAFVQHDDLWVIRKPHFLSFIIPTYNRASTIGKAIDSIYRQTDLQIPFEVICTDDCSTDRTLDILKRYQQKYENFHYYLHKQNGGASAARNTCVAHAQGDIIFNLDSDNMLAPNSVQKLVDYMDETGCHMACFQEIRYFTDTNAHHHSYFHRVKNNRFDLKDMIQLSRSPLSSGNYLFTRRCYDQTGGYHGRVRETWTFGWKQLVLGYEVAILPDTCYLHKVSMDSKWSQMEKEGRNDPIVLETLQAYPEVFTEGSNNMLVTYDVRKRKIHQDMVNDSFKLIDDELIEHIFAAYRFEADGCYEEALDAYFAAHKLGCTNSKIKRKISELQAKLITL